MASTTANLIRELLDEATISSLVGNRVYNGIPPRTSDDYLFVLKESEESWEDLESHTRPMVERFRLECYSRSVARIRGEPNGLAWAVRSHLNDFSGVLGGDRSVQNIFLEDVSDDFEPLGHGDDGANHWAAFFLEIYNFDS